MKAKYNILVTGCGGDIGQSIGKVLNEYDNVEHLYGCDISDKNAGRFIYENFLKGVRCTDEGYISFLEQLVIEKDIDFIIPIAEPELRFLSGKGIYKNIGKAKLIMASPESLIIGFDKLKTAMFLKENELPFPESYSVSKVEEINSFPVIIKSKTGSGSSKVYLVEDADSFSFLKKKNPDFIVQEYLDAEEGEYTCGLFRSHNGVVRNIIFKRELTGGYSGYGEVVQNNQISSLLENVAVKLNLVGSINVQLRLTDNGPIIFEINPRFSSTVLFRHLFGFKDLIWSIEDANGIPISDYEPESVGRKFYKGFSEYIL